MEGWRERGRGREEWKKGGREGKEWTASDLMVLGIALFNSHDPRRQALLLTVITDERMETNTNELIVTPQSFLFQNPYFVDFTLTLPPFFNTSENLNK